MWVQTLLTAATTLLIAPATAAWIDASETDRLTSKKIAMQSLAPKNGFKQSGRDVRTRLVVICDNPYNDPKQFPDGDYYSSFLQFSERIGVIQIPLRYVFDDREPIAGTYELKARGTGVHLTTPPYQDEFIAALVRSARLRVELDLPWAKSPILEFDVRGARDALRRIPCRHNIP